MATGTISNINDKRQDLPLREAVDRFLGYIKKNIETEMYNNSVWDDAVVNGMLNTVRVAGRDPFLKIEKGKKVCGYVVKNDTNSNRRGDILDKTFFFGKPAPSRVLGNVLDNRFALAA